MTTLKTWTAGTEGAPGLVFVHGWTCTHETMAPLATRFEGSHRCTSVDLLGHGQSPKAPRYAIADQADAIEETLGQSLADQVVIGHSMGGQIALELAARGTIAAAILLDPAPIVPHAKAAEFVSGMRAQLPKVNISSIMGAFARNQFRQPVEAGVVESLVRTMQACDPDVVRKAWDGIADYNGKAALARLDRPLLVIFADKPLNDVRAFAKASPYVETAQTAGAGHMQQLEVPDQLDAMIRRFLAVMSV